MVVVDVILKMEVTKELGEMVDRAGFGHLP